MISIILAKKIASLFLILLVGFISVKANIVDSGDSKVLSRLSLYAISPCMIINSFMIDLTDDIKTGLILAVLAAVITHIIFMIATALLKKPLKLTRVEQASLIYTNAGALIVPIVTSIFGPEWIIYTIGYVCVFLVLNWTHMITLLSGQSTMDFKKIMTNPNIISLFIGLFLLLTGIKLPYSIADSIAMLSTMVGPVAMIIAGMLLASLNLKQIFLDKRAWMVSLIRLIVLPLIIVAFYKFSPLNLLSANGETVLLISLLSASSASASNVIQMSQTFTSTEAAKQATAINIITTTACILTMPLMVFLYQL